MTTLESPPKAAVEWWVREAGPADAPAVAALLERVSPVSRLRRFFSASRVAVELEVRAVTELDGRTRVGVAAESDGDVIGFGRWIAVDGNAEAAILVDDAWQGRGVGRAIAHALVAAALEREIDRMTYGVQVDNWAAMQFSTRGPYRRRTSMEGGVIEGVIDLHDGTPATRRTP